MRILFLLLCCLLTVPTFCQQINWLHFDTSITKKRNLLYLNDSLEQIKSTAKLRGDDITTARCWQYQLQIADTRNDDSLFLANSYFIDSLLNEPTSKPFLRSMMHLLQAQRLALFQSKFSNNRKRSLVVVPPGVLDYRMLSDSQLDTLVQIHFEQARLSTAEQANLRIQDLIWLSGNPLILLFKPSYNDIVFAEQISYLKANRRAEMNLQDDWLSIPPDSLLKSDALPAGLDIALLPVFCKYKEWANSNTDYPEAYFFIESLARQYFYLHNRKKEDQRYEKYLLQSQQSPHAAVRGHAVYKLAQYWKELGSKYATSVYQRSGAATRFDTAYRYHLARTVQLIEQSSALLDSFLYLKQQIEDLRQSILSTSLELSTLTNQLPGDSIPLHLNFKNIDTIFYSIVRLDCRKYLLQSKWLDKEKLKHAAAFSSGQITLPVVTDFQPHATTFRLAGLPNGYYAFRYHPNKQTTENSQPQYFTFQVTSLAVLNNDNRIYVLNRASGKPINTAKLLVRYLAGDPDDYNKKSIAKITNGEGYAIVNKPSLQSVVVMYGNDTMSNELSEQEGEKPRDAYDEDDYDNMLEYYVDNLKLHLFTDRAIYRPGQKVQYKGILMTRNPATGDFILVNKQNIRVSLLKKIFSKKAKQLGKGGFYLYIEDAFRKQVDSIKVQCNEYGSFTGTYQLSTQAATGRWHFDTDDVAIESPDNRGFKVEAYKRPTFEVKLLKPDHYLQLGDSFFVKVKVNSFAGASLGNVAIQYSVRAEGYLALLPVGNKVTNEQGINQQLADSTVTTNTNGDAFIKVPAQFLKAHSLNNEKYNALNYSIQARAVDATGESHDEQLQVKLDNRPVKINAEIKSTYERNELKQLSITTKSVFSGALVKPLTVEIYALDESTAVTSNDRLSNDYCFVNSDWQYIYPAIQQAEAKQHLVFSTVVDSGLFIWPMALMKAGEYKIEMKCFDNGRLVGNIDRTFSVFDLTADELPDNDATLDHLPFHNAVAGDSIRWYTGSADTGTWRLLHVQYFIATQNGTRLQHQYAYQLATKRISQWTIQLPINAIDGTVVLTQLYVLRNDLVELTGRVNVINTISEKPEIVVEQYRRVLTPGSAETFVVSIKTGNDQTAAELLTTMYDASLDKLEQHRWRLPQGKAHPHNSSNWQQSIHSTTSGTRWNNPGLSVVSVLANQHSMRTSLPLWWLNPLDYAYDSMRGLNKSSDVKVDNMYFLTGRVSGLSITSGQGFDEVVVTSQASRRELTGSIASVSIRGATSLGSYNIPLTIIDGIIYEGDLSNIDMNSITDALILKGADASALYGSRASSGVMVLSTKGKVQLPTPEAPPVVVRKNFAETAFFLPQVYADVNGQYNIQFEIPESVTEWNWKLLAHTKAAEFMYLQKIIHTQLPMMVQPNMPRFLYQGDMIQLKTRITNLDTLPLNGSSTCKIEDAVTGEDITALLLKNDHQDFQVDRKSNSRVGYQITVPDTFLHPIKIRITARAGSFSDGEEYTIPVTSKAILVSQNVPFVLAQHPDTALQLPALPKDADIYGLALYISPKPQAALINALPYLSTYPYNCAEQTFNKLLANVLALHLIQTDTLAQQTMAALPEISEAKPSALPEELGEQTMPWLQFGNATRRQQQQLQQLFDTDRSKQKITEHMKRLIKLQTADGGCAWFAGGKSDRYISNYLLYAFGRLRADSLPLLFNHDMNLLYNPYLPKLLQYCDELPNSGIVNLNTALHYLYARRYWVNQYPPSASMQLWTDSILGSAWINADELSLNEQAMLVSTSLVFKGNREVYYHKAVAHLESLRQLAVTDAALGTRWKALSNADDLSTSGEETISNLATAYLEAGQSKTVVAGIIQWLLQAKEQHAWSNTKATAAVVGLLQQQQASPTGMPISLNSGSLQVTDNLLQGQLADFEPMDRLPATINVKQSGNGIVKGGFNLYYFTAEPPANELSTGISICKQLHRMNKATNQWEPVDSSTQLHLADQVRTNITISSRRPLQYVLIDDKRAAAVEPVDGSSGYHYASGWNYYQSVRDVGHQFFASGIPAGESTITYETIVSKAGRFTNGPVSLQCMYQPALRVYGAGSTIRVED